MSNIGLIDHDVAKLIEYKKASKEKQATMVCNQLSMVDDYQFHSFWFPMANTELYRELQYEWRYHYYFRHGVHKENLKRALKTFRLKKVPVLLWDWITWPMWVEINYLKYVKIPFIIRRTIGDK